MYVVNLLFNTNLRVVLPYMLYPVVIRVKIRIELPWTM